MLKEFKKSQIVNQIVMPVTQKVPTKREVAIQSFINKNQSNVVNYKGYVFITYVAQNGKLCAATFADKGFRPYSNYSFRNEESRAKEIESTKEMVDRQTARTASYLETANKEKEQFKVGGILVCSWGYEQTNINFYQIISRKNDFIILQEIGKTITDNQYDRGHCVANPSNLIGEPMRKKITKYASIKLSSFETARPWDGKPEYWSSYA